MRVAPAAGQRNTAATVGGNIRWRLTKKEQSTNGFRIITGIPFPQLGLLDYQKLSVAEILAAVTS